MVMSDLTSPPGAVVIVPVKPLALGKSRLGGLSSERRQELAGAFARDTVSAALHTTGVEAVLVVTDDHRFAVDVLAIERTVDRDARERCAVIPDGVSDDLNATLVQAAAEAARRWPGRHPVAVCADLPALRPDDLAAALSQAVPRQRPSFVRDAAGDGTTMYAAPQASFAPHFGRGSAALHLEVGADEVTGELPTLRQDVDDTGDLSRVLALGVGEHTASLMAG